MSTRHLSRTIAMQTLYEWDFNHRSQKLNDLIVRNVGESLGNESGQEFVEDLVHGVTKNIKDIDAKIAEFAPDWPIEKITIVDRNVLRLGIYEMLFKKEVPAKVIINEAIEMAKAFGGASSGKFVNGVLGAVYNNTDGLVDNPAPQPEVEGEPKEISVGGVVFNDKEKEIKFALIKDAFDKWTFAKGKIGDNVEGEQAMQALVRELQEELGIEKIEILDVLDFINVTVHQPGTEAYAKRIFYYLVRTTDDKLKAEGTKTVKDAQWFSAEEVLKKLDYENAKDIFKMALDKLKNNN